MTYTYKGKKVKLHGIFQHSYVIPPSLTVGGDSGGQISAPVAVIEFENGEFKQVSDISSISKKVSDEE